MSKFVFGFSNLVQKFVSKNSHQTETIIGFSTPFSTIFAKNQIISSCSSHVAGHCRCQPENPNVSKILMEILFWSKCGAIISFSFEFCAYSTENQPNRTRFRHIAHILGVAEDASTYLRRICRRGGLITKISGLRAKTVA